MRIISFIDQPDVVKKILQHLGLWEESHAPPDRNQGKKQITFDPFPRLLGNVQPYLETARELT